MRWRWPLILMLLACLALASDMVSRVNHALGCYAVLALMITTAMAASVHASGKRERAITILALMGMVLLHFAVRVFCQWSVEVVVHTAQGDHTIHGDHWYMDPTDDPAAMPFQGINDEWAVIKVDDTPCTITWWAGSEGVDQRAPLGAFFAARKLVGMPTPMPLLALFSISILLLFVWSRAFIAQLPALSQLMGTRAGMSMVFIVGLLAASLVAPPHAWLNNEFLSRPDDWLCYEKGARAMLAGNVLLMPPPGGVELWSALYTPVVAVLHVLLGPAITPLYIVQYATLLLLVPLMLRLVRSQQPWFRSIVAVSTLCFVLVDVNLNYAWHLLSDTAPLLLLVALIAELRERRDPVRLAVITGLLYLFRLEFIAMGVLVFFCFLLKGSTGRDRTRFILVHLCFLLPYFIRWWLLYGTVRPFPVAMEGTGHVPMEVLMTAQHITLKLRALFGEYSAINPHLRMRWHWIPVHAGFLITLGIALRKQIFDRQLVFILLVFGYVMLTRMFSPSVGIYGHRHSLALILLEGVLVLLVIDRWLLRAPSR